MIRLNFLKSSSDRRPKRKNIWDLFWHIVGIHNDRNSMRGFMRENFTCEMLNKQPSKELIKRYNLRYDHSEPFVWWLLENYFNGNLTEKKDDTGT